MFEYASNSAFRSEQQFHLLDYHYTRHPVRRLLTNRLDFHRLDVDETMPLGGLVVSPLPVEHGESEFLTQGCVVSTNVSEHMAELHTERLRAVGEYHVCEVWDDFDYASL